MNDPGGTTPGAPARRPRAGAHRRGLTRAWTPRARRRAASLVVVALVATLGLVVQSVISATQSPAFAAAGVPAAPVLLFNETFENGTGADPVDVDAYVGTGGTQYTGDPYFVDQANCNGVLVQYANTNFPLTGVCTQPNIADSRSNIRRFA